MRPVRVTPLLLPVIALAFAGCPDADDRVGDGVLKPLDASGGVDATPRPDATDPRGEFGDDCLFDADCQSGLCTPSAAGGGVCTSACDDDCPAGYACLPGPGAGGDICWRLDAVACQPCSADAECQLGGQTGNACLDYGAAGSFCGLACDGEAGACPGGYDCVSGQCRATSGVCACNAAGVLAEATTTCAVENEHGSCEGVRRCGAGGLTPCAAQVPAAEICNGKDDNCDGETDEGVDGEPCSLTNEFGTCVGAVSCDDGVQLCVGRAPAAEICNGVDDDCDGETDEGQPDLDEDGEADCTDPDIDGDGSPNEEDCQPRNPDVFPGQTEVCNGIDDNCNGETDEGVSGPETECGAYVCAGVDGCREDCDDDPHCAVGYLCDVEGELGPANTCLPSVCGNGQVELREVCDDGINDGGYGGCLPGCRGLGPRCGDGIRQGAFEACDDGPLNGTPNQCNATCDGITPPDCGNGVVEAGEACDLGEGNSDAPGATCRTDCTPQRCGDGIVDPQEGEACDAGAANGATVCGCQEGCGFASAEVVCRVSNGVCDVVERCTGQGTCPADGFAAEKLCRESGGVCDPAEYCDGTAATCPADARAGGETVCRESGGGCDPEEVCDGVAVGCPADVIRESGAVCREAAGDCDEAEVCDGETPTCPEDAFLGQQFVCRDAVGSCDVEERCSGESASCPEDAVLDGETTCREAAGACDVTEYCDGESGVCPEDELADAETVCNASLGACDPAEFCDGETAQCPTDLLAPAGTVCNASVGSCDPEETCSGEGPECPDDFVFPDFTPCSAGVGSCVSEPCFCLDAECEQLCGDGVINAIDDNSSHDDNATLYAEACDDGATNGARDACSLMCDGICDADFEWVRQAGGEARDIALAVAVDEAGTSHAAGIYRTFGGFAEAHGPSFGFGIGGAVFGEEVFFSNSGSEDFWVMVQDSDNAWLWSACGGGWGEDGATGVGLDDEGAVYVAGYFGYYADIGCCDGGGDVALSGAMMPCDDTLEATGGFSDYADVFLAKWDASGGYQWGVNAGSWGYDAAYDVATDSVGRSVVVGTHGGGEGSPARFGEHTLEGTGYRDIFVAKYDRNGGALWAHGGGSHGEDAAQGVTIGGDGQVYATGYFGGTFTWDDGETVFEHHGMESGGGNTELALGEGGMRELFVVALTPGGDVAWRFTAHASFGDIEGTSIAVTGDGATYVAGHFVGGEAVFGDLVVTAEGGGESSRMFVAKLVAGEPVWVSVADPTEDGGGGEHAWGVAVDRSGSAYVTGDFRGTIAFGPATLHSAEESFCCFYGPGLPQELGGIPIGFASRDGFVAKVGADGTWRWAKRFGGSYEDSGRAVGADPRGRVYLSGGFSTVADFDAITVEAFGGGQVPSAPSFGGGFYFDSDDAFVAKMVPDGAPRCFECGDGTVDPGEGCDDGDLDHCAGVCDGICFGPANFCGDGWDECDEQVDLGAATDPADAVCVYPTGNLWCFETAEDTFTLDPVEPGVAMQVGGGLVEVAAGPDLGGNIPPLGQHPDCPLCGDTTTVDCRGTGYRQWGGDQPREGIPNRAWCDGDPETPPGGDSPSAGTNDEAAAIECGDYYEFVANTGAEVAFEFDDRTTTQGPTHWSLWVSLSGAEGSFERVGGGETYQAVDFGAGIETPMNIVYLTNVILDAGPLRHQFDVHFRLYAWGAVSTEAGWVVDNVRVGAPSVPEPVATTTAIWCFEDAEGTFTTEPTVEIDTGSASTFSFGPDLSSTGSVAGNTGLAVCTASSTSAATATNWPTGGPEDGRYFEFAVDLTPGRYALSFEIRRSGTGIRALDVVSSASGLLFTGTVDDTTGWYPFSWTGNLPAGPQTIRLYGYQAEASGGTLRVDNFQLTPAP